MKYNEALNSLEKALKQQKTISIPKLKMLLQSLNISIYKSTRDMEVQRLKVEIYTLKKKVKKLKKRLKNV